MPRRAGVAEGGDDHGDGVPVQRPQAIAGEVPREVHQHIELVRAQERVEGEGLAVLDGHLTLFAERIRGGDGWKAIRIVQDENLALTTQPININIDKHGDLAIETFWKENTTC
jgi:hypothetical protein